MTSAESQTRWSFTTNSKSWTFMLDRDGGAVQSLDPLSQTPWTNGDLRSPDLSNPIIAGWDTAHYNINEACFLTIENVGTALQRPDHAAAGRHHPRHPRLGLPAVRHPDQPRLRSSATTRSTARRGSTAPPSPLAALRCSTPS